MTAKVSLDYLNCASAEEFVFVLGAVYEHSPWVAEKTAPQRPFHDLSHLAAALADTVRAAPAENRLRLIQAHPELAGKAAQRGELTQDSKREQQGAGLDQCSPDELEALQRLNRQYREKFGFPFVIAVRGHDRSSILAHLSRRIQNDREAEAQECIEQIIKIGTFRIENMLA